jgi:hypothetical protein
VRWQNFTSEEDTWENFGMFAYDAPEMVEDYLVGMLKVVDGELLPNEEQKPIL